MTLPTAEDLNALPYSRAVDLLFQRVDDALWAGDAAQAWPDIEAWLRDLDPTLLSTTLIVGVLSITLPVSHLPERCNWYVRAEEVLRDREGERTERLLRGLEARG